jgi:hypothetical protein
MAFKKEKLKSIVYDCVKDYVKLNGKISVSIFAWNSVSKESIRVSIWDSVWDSVRRSISNSTKFLVLNNMKDNVKRNTLTKVKSTVHSVNEKQRS